MFVYPLSRIHTLRETKIDINDGGGYRETYNQKTGVRKKTVEKAGASKSEHLVCEECALTPRFRKTWGRPFRIGHFASLGCALSVAQPMADAKRTEAP